MKANGETIGGVVLVIALIGLIWLGVSYELSPLMFILAGFGMFAVVGAVVGIVYALIDCIFAPSGREAQVIRDKAKNNAMRDCEAIMGGVNQPELPTPPVLPLPLKVPPPSVLTVPGLRCRKSDAVLVPRTSLIIIDGNNLVSYDDELRTKTLKAVLAALDANGYRYVVFFDKGIFRWLETEFNDKVGVDYIREGEAARVFHIAPSRAEADGQILQLADKEGAHVISCDRFRDYEKNYPWIKGSRNSCRVHGWNLVPVKGGVRALIVGFDLDIVVTKL